MVRLVQTHSGSCAPPHYEGVWIYNGYYSPGICPSGYVISAVHITTRRPLLVIHSGGAIKMPREVEPTGTAAAAMPRNEALFETLAFCVPSFWTLSSHPDSGYMRYATTALQVGVTAGHSEIPGNSPGSVSFVIDSVPAFPIRWAESDLSRLETHPLLATLTGTEPGQAPPTVTSTAPTNPGSESLDAGHVDGSHQQGLSGGAIAGIVIGILTLLVGIAFGLFIWRRMRRLPKRTREVVSSEKHEHPPYGPSELPEQFIGTRHELEQVTPVFELDAPTKDSSPKLGGEVRAENESSQITTTATAQVRETVQAPEPKVSVQPWSSSPSAVPLGSTVRDMPESSLTIAELKEGQLRLQERRQLLMELERIEQEEEIRKKLSQASQGEN
jgi:hypothetical protein